MKIHHLSCGSMCPILGRLFVNESGKMICHCLLLETSAGLVLVDTGFGVADLANPGRRLGRGFTLVTGLRRDTAETATEQVGRLGFQRGDVRHIVVTHMDLDHAGGIGDFPEATVHIHAPEHAAIMARATGNERRRYRPAQWEHARFDVIPDTGEGDAWFGFTAVRAVPGLEDVLYVPLHGHTRGHCGVAVHSDQGWLFHCGDAYFYAGEMNVDKPRCTFGLEVFQKITAIDDGARRRNQDRLRQLKRDHGTQITLFSTHDPTEFAA